MGRRRRKIERDAAKQGASKARRRVDTTLGRDEGLVRRRWILILLTLVVATTVAIAHWPALSARALSFDDSQYLTNNVLVQDPSWATTGRFLSEVLEPSTVGGYYQPLAMISLMLDYAMGGRPTDLRVFHRTSLILHVANTVLVIVFLYLLFPNPWIVASLGLLFGVHPLTVEPIPWVGERKTLLAAFFALASLIAYLRYCRKSGALASQPTLASQSPLASQSTGRYVACMMLYVFALMTKPTTTTLPALFLLLDFWPLNRLSRRGVMEKIPFFAVAGISAAITVVSQARTMAVTTPGEYPPMTVPLVWCHNIVFYLYKIVWPVDLSSHYPYPSPMDLTHPAVLAGVIGTTILIGALVLSMRWTRGWVVGFLFFFIAIFPTMGGIGFTNVIASDKYLYLPAVGLLVTLAWCGTYLSRSRFTLRKPKLLAGGAVLVVAVVAGMEAGATRRQLTYWRDTETLYEHMIALAPDAPSLYWNLGYFLYHQGRVGDAIDRFEQSLEIDPDSPEAHANLAGALTQQGRMADALEHYEVAFRRRPGSHTAHNNYGVLLVQVGRPEDAIEQFSTATRLKPTFAQAYGNLGRALSEVGRFDEAVAALQAAIEINSKDPGVQFALGEAWEARGDFERAAEQFRKTLELDPDSAMVRNRLDTVLTKLGE